MSTLLKQVAEPQGHDTTYIYALVDPTTGYVRYVGKANKPTYRLKMHLTPGEMRETSHKNSWLRGLLNQGTKPELIVLEVVLKSEWQCAERRWIAYYRSIPNYPTLTNTVDGGEGVEGYVLSDEQKRSRSERQKGRKMPQGHGDKVRAALKGFIHSDESRANMSKAKKKIWQNLSPENRIEIGKKIRASITQESRNKTGNANRNSPKLPNASSQYRGVMRVRRNKPWQACCTVSKRRKHIGFFAIEEDAARARDRFILESFPGWNIELNFPRSDYQ